MFFLKIMGGNLFNLAELARLLLIKAETGGIKIERRKNIEWFIPGCVFKRERSDCQYLKDQSYRFGNSADSRDSIGFSGKWS